MGIGHLTTNKSIEHAMREIKDWLAKVNVSGLNLILQYDPRLNIAVAKFKLKGKDYEFRSTSQSNCRLNMHAIARVMEFKVRAHLMGIEKFDTSMSPYLRLEGPASAPVQPQSTNEKAYVVLGISPLASNDELQVKYKSLMRSFHPDMALSNEAKKEFEKRAAEINEAWAIIKQERGL